MTSCGCEEVTITLEALDWWYVVQALKEVRDPSLLEAGEDPSFFGPESMARLTGVIERQLLKGVVLRRLAQLPRSEPRVGLGSPHHSLG